MSDKPSFTEAELASIEEWAKADLRGNFGQHPCGWPLRNIFAERHYRAEVFVISGRGLSTPLTARHRD